MGIRTNQMKIKLRYISVLERLLYFHLLSVFIVVWFFFGVFLFLVCFSI